MARTETKLVREREYLSDALGHSSHRRMLFIDAFSDLRLSIEGEANDRNLISNIVESFHASATIVDDIQDNDYSRKGFPTYFVRHDV